MTNRKPITAALRAVEDPDVTIWELPEGAVARLGRGSLEDVEFSQDGAYLTVATRIGFWIYDTATMAPRALWGSERGVFNVATFSYDARWIATGDWDGIVKVWDTQNGRCITKIDWGSTRRLNNVLHVHFSPDGQHLAASGVGHSTVYDWRTNSETPLASFTVADPIRYKDYKGDAPYDRFFPISFSPNGNLFAYVSSPDTVTVSDIDTGDITARLTGHTAPVHTLLFSPCGQYLAGANIDSTVQVWNIQDASLAMLPTAYEGNRVRLAYTPDGTMRVADIYKNKVVIWDASQQEKLDTFNSSGMPGERSRFSTDGTQFAIFNTRGDIQVWKAGTPSTVALISGYRSTAYSVVFSQEGKTLVSNHWGKAGKVFWDVVNRQPQRTFPPLAGQHTFLGNAMALSPCEELLAVGTSESDIHVWHIASETLIAAFTEHERRVEAMAFSPNGGYLVSAGWADEIYVWDVARWEKRHSLPGHTGSVVALAFHPDGQQLVTSSRDGTTRLWNVDSGEKVVPLPLPDVLEDTTLYRGEPQNIQRVVEGGNLQWKRYQHIQSIVFSPCGSLIAGGLGTWIASGLTSEIRVWDAAALETRMVILPPQRRPWALAFSPCGHYLACGAWWQPGLDKAPIWLWDVATGENIHTFWGHATDVQDVAFSPDGTLLASGSFDGTVLLWDVTPF